MEQEKIKEVLASGLGVKPRVGKVCIGTAVQKSLLEEHMEEKMSGMEIKNVVIDEATKMTEEDYKRLEELRSRREARLEALKPVCSDCEHVIAGCTTICNKYPQRKPSSVARINKCEYKLTELGNNTMSNQLYYCDPELNTACKKTNCKILGTGEARCDGTRHIEFAKKPIEKIRVVLPYDKDLVEAANGLDM